MLCRGLEQARSSVTIDIPIVTALYFSSRIAGTSTMDYADSFFATINRELDTYAHHLRRRIFSTYRDMPWTDDHRRAMEPLLRTELDYVVTQILGIFDNIGCDRVPGGVLGYAITVLPDDTAGMGDDDMGVPLLPDGQDYADAWRDYLSNPHHVKTN